MVRWDSTESVLLLVGDSGSVQESRWGGLNLDLQPFSNLEMKRNQPKLLQVGGLNKSRKISRQCCALKFTIGLPDGPCAIRMQLDTDIAMILLTEVIPFNRLINEESKQEREHPKPNKRI